MDLSRPAIREWVAFAESTQEANPESDFRDEHEPTDTMGVPPELAQRDRPDGIPY